MEPQRDQSGAGRFNRCSPSSSSLTRAFGFLRRFTSIRRALNYLPLLLLLVAQNYCCNCATHVTTVAAATTLIWRYVTKRTTERCEQTKVISKDACYGVREATIRNWPGDSQQQQHSQG